jgi:predicted DNA-binding transcriptional regulator YafY
MRRAERLFRIVGMFRDKKVLTAADLSAALEVCERTIYRDIAHLQASGVGIEGVGGIGYIADDNLQLPPLNFSLDQLEALALGLSFVMAAGDKELAKGAAAAQAKIDAVLPQAIRPGLSVSPIVASRRASGRAPAHTAMLRRALRTIVEVDYQSEQSQPAKRRLRPMALTAFTDCWTISGWCEMRQALRNFRLDRIENLRMTEDRFDGIPDHDIDADVQRRRDLLVHRHHVSA